MNILVHKVQVVLSCKVKGQLQNKNIPYPRMMTHPSTNITEANKTIYVIEESMTHAFKMFDNYA